MPHRHQPLGPSRRPRHLALAALATGVCIISLSAPAAAGARFVKQPYLQGLQPDRVMVRWEGSEPTGGEVEIHPAGSKDKKASQTFTTEEPEFFHSLWVKGLKPATRYEYSVKVGEAKSKPQTFVTAPAESKDFTFLLYGDSRDDHTAHRGVIAKMLADPSDFLINTGDMVGIGSKAQQWQTFFDIEAPLLAKRCVFACIGNHEMLGGGQNKFLKYFHPGVQLKNESRLFYSIRWGNTRFFFLNAFAGWNKAEDKGWLLGELDRAKSEQGLVWRIVVMHQGPFSSGPHGPNPMLPRRGIIEAMAKGGVDLVLAGHDHLYERGEAEGVRYLISGGAGAPLYKPRLPLNKATKGLEPAHHYVRVKVSATAIQTTALKADGGELERCNLTKAKGFECKGNVDPARFVPKAAKPSPKPAPSKPKSNCDCGMASPLGSSWAPVTAALALCMALLRRRRQA